MNIETHKQTELGEIDKTLKEDEEKCLFVFLCFISSFSTKTNQNKQNFPCNPILKHINRDRAASGEDDEIDKTLKEDEEKLKQVRQLLAKKNRDIALVQRKIDEIPSRAELQQYQRQ
jgi:hypothetical protein